MVKQLLQGPVAVQQKNLALIAGILATQLANPISRNRICTHLQFRLWGRIKTLESG